MTALNKKGVLSPKSDADRARDVALQLLSRREHTRAELANKLRAKGYQASLIDALLADLESNRYLDNRRAIETYICQRVAKGYGELKIVAELRGKGLDGSQARQAIEAAAVDWGSVARRVFEKKCANSGEADAKARARQQRFLLSRGFSQDIVRQLFK